MFAHLLELVAEATIRGAGTNDTAAGGQSTKTAQTMLRRQRCQAVVCKAAVRNPHIYVVTRTISIIIDVNNVITFFDTFFEVL